jgi:hypothetical protein
LSLTTTERIRPMDKRPMSDRFDGYTVELFLDEDRD